MENKEQRNIYVYYTTIGHKNCMVKKKKKKIGYKKESHCSPKTYSRVYALLTILIGIVVQYRYLLKIPANKTFIVLLL